MLCLVIANLVGNVYQVVAKPCDVSSITIAPESREDLLEIMQDGTNRGVLIEFSSICTPCHYDSLPVSEVCRSTPWIFVKDAKALFLIKLPAETSLFFAHSELLQKVKIDLSASNKQCDLCSSQNKVNEFMYRELWNQLRLGQSTTESNTLPLYDYICLDADFWTGLRLQCWKEGQTDAIYPKTTGTQIVASFVAIATCFLLPLILIFSIQRGIFKDEDDDECFGLNVYPFPLGINYYVFVWRPKYKPTRCLVYFVRFIGVEMCYVILAKLRDSYFEQLEGVMIIFPSPLLVNIYLITMVFGFCSIMSFHSSLSGTEPNRNLATDVVLPQNDYDDFLLKYPKLSTENFTDFIASYIAWIHCLFRKTKDTRCKTLSFICVVFYVILLSPFVMFASWILRFCLEIFHKQVNRYLRYIFIFCFYIVILSVFVLKSTGRKLPPTLDIYISVVTSHKQLGAILVHLFIEVVLHTVTKKRVAACLTQSIDVYYVVIGKIVHIWCSLALTAFLVRCLYNIFYFCLITPISIVILGILYPHDVHVSPYSYYLIVSVTMTYVIIKPIITLTDEYSSFFRRIVLIVKKHKDRKIQTPRCNSDSSYEPATDTSLNSQASLIGHEDGNEEVSTEHTNLLSLSADESSIQNEETDTQSVRIDPAVEYRNTDIDVPYVKSRIFWALVKKHKPIPKSLVYMLLHIVIPSAILLCGFEILHYAGELDSLNQQQQIIGFIVLTLGLPLFNLVFNSKESKLRSDQTLEFRLYDDIELLLQNPDAFNTTGACVV